MSTARKKIAPVPALPPPPIRATRESVIDGLRAFNADTGRAMLSLNQYDKAAESLRKTDPSVPYPSTYRIRRFFADLPEAWRAAGVEPEAGEAPSRPTSKAAASKGGSLSSRLERFAAEVLALKADVQELEARAAKAEGSLAKVRAAQRALASLEL